MSNFEICEPLLDYYVYVYMDPLNDNEVFYVGKGQKDRNTSHRKIAKALDWENEDVREAHNKGKIEKINLIESAGLEPLIIIIGRYKTEREAFAVESTLIHWVYGKENLTNIASGHNHEHIRKLGNLQPVYPRLEIEKQRKNDGSFTRDRVVGPYIEFDIEDKLWTLRNSLVKAGYPFGEPKLVGQDAFISLALKGQSLFSITIGIGLNRMAKVGVNLRVNEATKENVNRFRSYLLEQMNEAEFTEHDIRGHGKIGTNEPRYFLHPKWKGTQGRLDPVKQLEEVLNRVDWYLNKFRLRK